MVKPRANGGLSKTWAHRRNDSVSTGGFVSLGLGLYPIITLAKARSKALDNARAVADGSDPREKPSAVPIFVESAVESANAVIDIHRAGWKDAGRSAQIWQSSLNRYAIPQIGT